MNKFKLTREEKAIEAAIERGEYVPVTGKKRQEMLDALAAWRKNRMMTIRVSGWAIKEIRRATESRGVPYQSYISEVIYHLAHQLARSKGKAIVPPWRFAKKIAPTPIKK